MAPNSVLSRLARLSGAEPLLCGTGTPADCVHAPNESFALAQFRMGYLFVGMFLSAQNG